MAEPTDSDVHSPEPTSKTIHFLVLYYQYTLHKTHILGPVIDFKGLC
jgi:hypothetical protein